MGGIDMRKHILFAAITALAVPQLANAQDHDLESQLRPFLAPPEMVMRFQRQLNINDDQRQAIQEKITELQTEIMDLQWDLQDQGQTLVELVSQETADLSDALMQLDRVLDVESSIKKRHMRMLLEIRQILNTEQRLRLQELMEEMAMREMREGERRRPNLEPDSRMYEHSRDLRERMPD
jgi:Spy/CpxP family protein refolding chaperone